MSLKTILFIDPVCPRPYAPDHFEGVGGTEQTVVRVAEALSHTRMFSVWCEQRQRTETQPGNVWYAPPNACTQADYVVCLRDPSSMLEARRRFPNAKIYLWAHDLAPINYGSTLPYFHDAKCAANLVVSNFHKTQTVDRLIPWGYEGEFPTRVVYNPIADDLLPDNTPYDRNKLMWASSPHKGLDYALTLFRSLRDFNPDFKMHVANPGYIPSSQTEDTGVVVLGALSHREVINHLRQSLCLFYPNVVFPETYGLVFAEADAVGTPVLTHSHGAAHEICQHPYEVTDCRDPKKVIDRVMSWWEGGRPHVKANPKFRMSEVLKSWTRLFQ